MTYYLVETYHGPLVYSQQAGRWTVATPYRPEEIYHGTIPAGCLRHARPIPADHARRILDPSGTPPVSMAWVTA